ncbi:hypothetical protein DSM104443_03272 [Usitatibacter rugosus]|uniref:Uncharacterized protein n=1 Tax=Usitatibacter rugosus TaxID=2732067 RepID=A0A6M4H2Z3_9PROT|nr:hypothetical protein [Usitatibacter rugosus]QJR12187.1 hypothetical protein DSM104443_03272 [Usitatibacter rugosus]
MNPLSRRCLLAAAVASSLASPALAVRLDDDGLGQALIHPYYTTRIVQGAQFNTYLSVVNHTDTVKALRVNFREARNGRVMLAVNAFLAPYDVWTVALVPNDEQAGAATRLLTADESCTDPPLPFTPSVLFSNAAYTGANSDGLGDGLDRTREGYVEMIEMATLTGASAAAATMSLSGVPTNCAALRGASVLTAAAPTGGIAGTLTLINVNDGLDFTLGAEALAELSRQPYYRPVTDPYPGFNAAEITPVSVVGVGSKVYRAAWSSGTQAVSAVLARREGMGEFVLDGATLSRTDMVVTLPLRPYAPSSDGVAFTLDYRDREGRGQSAIPCEGPFAPTCSAQWDRVASVITFDGGLPHTQDDVGVLSASTGPLITTSGGGFNQPPMTTRTTRIRLGEDPVANGSFSWRVGPAGNTVTSLPTSQVIDTVTGLVTTGSQTYVGLPAVGFTLRTFRNGNLACGTATCQGNYGGSFPLKFRRDIATP